MADFLTRTSISYTDKMMKRWDTLARLLIVKHNDQMSPAYAPAFIDAVKDQTGSRYVRKEIHR